MKSSGSIFDRSNGNERRTTQQQQQRQRKRPRPSFSEDSITGSDEHRQHEREPPPPPPPLHPPWERGNVYNHTLNEEYVRLAEAAAAALEARLFLPHPLHTSAAKPPSPPPPLPPSPQKKSAANISDVEAAAAALEARLFSRSLNTTSVVTAVSSPVSSPTRDERSAANETPSPRTSEEQCAASASDAPFSPDKSEKEETDENIQNSNLKKAPSIPPPVTSVPSVPTTPPHAISTPPTSTSPPVKPTTTTLSPTTTTSTPPQIITQKSKLQLKIPPAKKKSKPVNPFRVKVGSIVALRYGKHVTTPPHIIPPPTLLSRSNNSNNNDRKFYHVWAEPIPGRDDGLALIGKRIRCIFPKVAVQSILALQTKKEGGETTTTKKKLCRILEGEVISILPPHPPPNSLNQNPKHVKRKRNVPYNLQVQLLIPKQTLASMPFLSFYNKQQQDSEEKVVANKTDGEKKRQKFEEFIRGKDNTLVTIALRDVVMNNANVVVEPAENGENENKTLLVARWVVRKTISIPTDAIAVSVRPGRKKKEKDGNNGTIISSSSLYIGDKNDASSQQEKNWRWWAGSLSHYSSFWKKRRIGKENIVSGGATDAENNGNSRDDGSYKGVKVSDNCTADINDSNDASEDGCFIGEVLKVVPSPQLTQTKNSSSTSNNTSPPSTLAMVTLRRLCLPEHTIYGRMSHDGFMEVFDIDYSLEVNALKASMKEVGESTPPGIKEEGYSKGAEVNDASYSSSDLCYQVPVEDLIVISRRLERQDGLASNGGDSAPDLAASFMNVNSLTMAHSYSFWKDSFTQLGHLQSNGDMEIARKNSSDICDSLLTKNDRRNNNDGVNSMGIETQEEKKQRVCHRCRRKKDVSNMKLCSSEHCSSSPGMVLTSYDTVPSDADSKWWCGDCCQTLRNVGAFCLCHQSLNWIGPCCLGVCDCTECSMERRTNFNRLCLPKNGEFDVKDGAQDECQLSGRKTCSGCLWACAKGFVCCSSCSNLQHKDCSAWERTLTYQYLLQHNGKCDESSSEEDEGCTMGKGGSLSIKESDDENLWSDCSSGVNGYHPDNALKRKKSKKRKNKIGQHNSSFTCRNCFHRRKMGRTKSCVNIGIFRELHESITTACPLEFELPADLMEIAPIPSLEHISSPLRTKNRKHTAMPKKRSTLKKQSKKRAPKEKISVEKELQSRNKINKKSYPLEEDVFKPTCCRLLPYDPHRKMKGEPGSSKNDVEVHNSHRREAMKNAGRKNARAQDKSFTNLEKKISSRAARANQRRMLKDVASFGASKIALDKLSGCEQQLRFGKSRIHGWGVFADEGIGAGDLIVEYRGELIGNAVADRREKEYEKAKIGSDYMFRIDNNIVCDATKQGNVARFINASCSPNCYTQIITINGCKRIAIYAQRDIRSGEELCYDYKFPLEYDEEKRIKCHCSSPDCRGYMNWDKKYVIVPKGSE